LGLNFLEISSYFPRKKTGAKTRLVAAIGIGSSTGTSYSVLVLAVLKLFNSVMFLMPILAKEIVSRELCQHQNRLPFSLLLSFGQTKERRESCTSKERK